MPLLRRYALEVIVFAMALAVRLAVPVLSGGFHGFVGSDPAVYYTSALALTFGELPYRDFILVHPPLVAFVLLPAAWVGRFTSDHTGFIVANLMIMTLGALNAALVVRLAKILGMSAAAAVSGGLFYALWAGAFGSEYAARLEPVGNTLFLGAVLALAHARLRPPSARFFDRTSVLAGALLGLAMSSKIWWAMPVVFVLAWEWLASRDVRRFRSILLGGVGAAIALNGPLFVLAPRRMWNLVVGAQVGRPRWHTELDYRLSALARIGESFHTAPGTVVGLVFWVLILGCVVAAVRLRSARPFAILLVLQVVVLLASPSFFPGYADFISVSAALTIAGAVETAQGSTWRWVVRMRPALPVMVALGLGTTAVLRLTHGEPLVQRIPDRAALLSAASGQRCIMAELPMNLIVVGALNRSFALGCRNVVDVRGQALTLESTGPKNVVARRWLIGYLREGDAIILNHHSLLTIGQEPALRPVTVLADNGQYTLFKPRP